VKWTTTQKKKEKRISRLLCRNCRFISSLIILIISGCFLLCCVCDVLPGLIYLDFPFLSLVVLLTRWLTWLWNGVKINDWPPLLFVLLFLESFQQHTRSSWLDRQRQSFVSYNLEKPQ
jgi:hypothetical protein